MPLRIDPDNPKNIEFLEHIVNEIVKAKLEGHFKIADITVQQDTKIFPIFEKTKTSENVDTAAYETMMDTNKEIDQEAQAIYTYLYQTFQGEPGLGSVQRTNENPLTFEIRAVCKDEYKIFRIAEELKRKKPSRPITKRESIEVQEISLPMVEYDNQSGLGYVNGKEFKLKSSQPSYAVFAELYKNIGKVLPYARILELSGYIKNDKEEWIIFDKKRAKMALFSQGPKYFINKLAVKIRAKTGLGDIHLVLNSGDIVLRGIKLKKGTK
ncbi:MAG: hypothetical protein Q7S10_02925 [bacterium]|nr:hypothetical protein [bacterium]